MPIAAPARAGLTAGGPVSVPKPRACAWSSQPTVNVGLGGRRRPRPGAVRPQAGSPTDSRPDHQRHQSGLSTGGVWMTRSRPARPSDGAVRLWARSSLSGGAGGGDMTWAQVVSVDQSAPLATAIRWPVPHPTIPVDNCHLIRPPGRRTRDRPTSRGRCLAAARDTPSCVGESRQITHRDR
jgi:hypothetical protein